MGSTNQNSAPAKTFSSVICFKCRETGHIASRCPRLTSNDGKFKRPDAEHRVDLCVVNAPGGTLKHSGEQFLFSYDSGSECSLIKESIGNKLRGKRINKVVTMTGIGQTSVQSTLQILTLVEIDDMHLEILFHILLDEYMRHDIMIGREILGQGITIIMTLDKVKLTRNKTVNTCMRRELDIDFNNIDTDIPSSYKYHLLGILNEFKDHFVQGTPCIPAKVEPMQNRLKDPNITVNRAPYRLSLEERQIVRDKINELMNSNIIRPSCSPFASPILLVKKKDGSDRMCVDYRELNENTVSDRFPLPLISDQIDKLQGSYYFTILDMASGYHQIPVHPESVEKTAFVTPEGQFEYLTMPFGLKNAPAVFQRAVIKALGSLTNSYVAVYMDDILVLGNSDVNEALDRVRVVLKTLSDVGFTFNLKKCSFFKTKVQYLGFEVSQGQTSPNPKKIEALTNLPPPKTVTQVRQFNGLANYFRRFVPKFSQVMAPLYAITSSHKDQISWTKNLELVRQKIISILTNEPVLMLFDPECPVELHTDASSIGYGAVLIQVKSNVRHPVAYFSKRTTVAESKYHSYELETLAVVNAIEHFRHYLQGQHFVVITDCSSLQASKKKRVLASRVHRWWAFLQTFNFDIIFRDGTRMTHADFFSRNPLPEVQAQSVEKVQRMEVNMNNLPGNWLTAEQQRDPGISKLISDFNNHKLNNDVTKTYEIRSGVLYRKIQRNGKTRCLPILPKALWWSVINANHSALLHLGWEKTLEKVCEQFWFQHMAKNVRKFVDNCVTCKVAKGHSGRIQAELHSIPKVAIPWHTIHIDATGKLSGKNDRKEYVFVLIDAFTKYVVLNHTTNIDSASSIQAMKFSISLFGAPTRVIADQGRCFASTEFRDFCQSHNIELHLIATGSSRANGQVERVMSTLKNMLTAVETEGERSWQDALADVQLALNCTKSRVTKFSPIELLMGKVARPIDLMFTEENDAEFDLDQAREQAVNNIKTVASYDTIKFNSIKSKVNRFAIGDFVLLQNEERNQTKLDPKYRGPFKITQVLEGDRYVLSSLNSKRTYKYAHDRLRKMPEKKIESIEGPVETEDEVVDKQ